MFIYFCSYSSTRFLGTCTKHPAFEHLVKECNDAYSWGTEDTAQYSAGWNTPLNRSMRYKLRKNKRKALWMGLETPWRHRCMLILLSLILKEKFQFPNTALFRIFF